MRCYQCPVTQSVTYEGCNIKPGNLVTCLPTCKSNKLVRNVHFPNDVVFQDYVRHGELERIGRFIRTKSVTLDTIYPTGMAAIHEAVLSGNLECVKLLVKYGADIIQRDEDGCTPLHMACSDGFPHIANLWRSGSCCLSAPTPRPRTTAERNLLTSSTLTAKSWWRCLASEETEPTTRLEP